MPMRAAVAVVLVWVLALPSALAQEPPDAYPAPPTHAPTQPPAQPGYGQGYQPPSAIPPPPIVHRRPSTRVEQNLAFYGELLGKGIIYGVGMDYNFNKWIGLGGVFSYFSVDSLEGGVIAPYVAFYAGGYKSTFVAHVGPQLNFGSSGGWWIWEGDESVMVKGQTSVGYEYRNGFLFRVMLTLFFDQNDTALLPGFTFGGAF